MDAFLYHAQAIPVGFVDADFLAMNALFVSRMSPNNILIILFTRNTN